LNRRPTRTFYTQSHVVYTIRCLTQKRNTRK